MGYNEDNEESEWKMKWYLNKEINIHYLFLEVIKKNEKSESNSTFIFPYFMLHFFNMLQIVLYSVVS